MIADTKYYLGGSDQNYSAEQAYAAERSANVRTGNNKSWIGKVAVMYPSDYLYVYANEVNQKCFDNGYECWNYFNVSHPKSFNWMQMYNDTLLLTPNAQYDDSSLLITSFGRQLGLIKSNSSGFVKIIGCLYPVVYLNENVKTISGTGDIVSPYILSN